MKRWFGRWFGDTLFTRLFVLMWVALVASHLLGYTAAHQGAPAGARGPGMPPPMPSLPPMGGPPHPAPGGERGPPPPFPHGPPPQPTLWLDYLVRALAIAAAAAWGARWLSAPIRRLGGAAQQLGESLRLGRAPAPLDESSGTVEVRETAHVFNTMATQLQDQFAAQQLLMAAISHDLRTPLARLRLRVEQMPPGDLADRCVADIREMDTLVDGALSLLREQHDPSARARVDLASLLLAVADDEAEQGHAVAFDGDTPAVVDGQPAALKRLFGNLVGNAVRHGGSAAVRLATMDGAVRVTIDDDGPGIPADRLDAVFHPFYRLDTTGAAPGAGLGLHIARDLARQHGGTVALANRPEGGLRATVTLPRAADATVSPATQSSETRDTADPHTGAV